MKTSVAEQRFTALYPHARVEERASGVAGLKRYTVFAGDYICAEALSRAQAFKLSLELAAEGYIQPDPTENQSITVRPKDGPAYRLQEQDLGHLIALQDSLRREKQRLASSTTEHERAMRTVWVAQIQREIDGEYRFLGMTPDSELPQLSNDQLLRELTI